MCRLSTLSKFGCSITRNDFFLKFSDVSSVVLFLMTYCSPIRETTALTKLEDIISRRLRWLGHLSRMDHHRLPRKLLYGNPMVSGGVQVDRDRTGKMSSRKISGKWASAGTRLKRTGGAGGIVSPNASLTWDEPGTRNL